MKEKKWQKYLHLLVEWHAAPSVTTWEEVECAFWDWYAA